MGTAVNRVVPIIIFLVTFLTACNSPDRVKTLYLAHNLPTSHPVHRGILDFQSELEKQSGGKLLVRLYPGGQLGSERECIELLQIGSISMTKVSAATMANFASEYKVLGVPYLFRDEAHRFNVLEGEVGRELLESGVSYYLKGLCFFDAGSRSFYTTKHPIRNPEDLNGQKIRVMNHQMSIDMVNAMGGAATPMAYGELFTALQQGVVDGAENNPPSFVSSRHFEVCKYYTLDEHSSIPDVLLISTKTWDRLSEAEQKWVRVAAEYSAQTQKQYWAESVAECMSVLDSAGVEVIRPEKSPFADRTESVLEEFGTDPKMKTLVQRIQEIE